jgi:hypothetical protein
MITEKVGVYETWADFRHELQRRSGVVLLNPIWLQIRPKAPLPWDGDQMRAALERLTQGQREQL